MKSALPFDPEKRESLRQELTKVLEQLQAGRIASKDAIEEVIYALLSALNDSKE